MIPVEEGQLIVFPYEHRYRLVLVARVWESKAGDQLITGLDEDRNELRTFRVDRIKGGRIKRVPSQSAKL